MKNDLDTFKIINTAGNDPGCWFGAKNIADKENWIQAFQDMQAYEERIQRMFRHKDSVNGLMDSAGSSPASLRRASPVTSRK